MSFNIIDAVKEHTNGQLLGQMSQLLGDESSKAGKAIDSAVPAMLNGLLSTTRTSRGADDLFSAVQEQDDKVIDNLGAMLSSGKASSVIHNGNKTFGDLLGGGGLGKLAGALSSFGGLSRGGTGSLMGMLSPVILGVLKRKVAVGGLNSASLARLFSDQSEHISKAMPAGLNNALTATGFLGGTSVSDTRTASNLGSAVAGGSVAGAASTMRASGVAATPNTRSSSVADSAGSARANTAASARTGSVNSETQRMTTEARRDVSGAVSGAGDAAQRGLRSTSTHLENAQSAAMDHSQEIVRTGSIWTKLLAPILILGLLAWAGYMFYLSQQGTGTAEAETATSTESSSSTDSTNSDSTNSSTSSN